LSNLPLPVDGVRPLPVDGERPLLLSSLSDLSGLVLIVLVVGVDPPLIKLKALLQAK
jgi:hypothetical protein